MILLLAPSVQVPRHRGADVRGPRRRDGDPPGERRGDLPQARPPRSGFRIFDKF